MFPNKKYSRRANPLTSYQFSRLHTFECVARHLSFSLAAEELSITPSAVSHRINLLEKELGFLLFQRFHRRITLTPDGERMQWALNHSFDALTQEILDIKNRELTGSLTIYSHPSLVQCLLIPRIGDFIALHPTIHLNILTGQENINLANRGVDLAMYFGRPPSDKQLDEIFMRESMVPICTEKYAKTHNLYNAPGNLADCTLLHDRYNSGEDGPGGVGGNSASWRGDGATQSGAGLDQKRRTDYPVYRHDLALRTQLFYVDALWASVA